MKPPTTTTVPITPKVIANAGLADMGAEVVGGVDAGVGLEVLVGVMVGVVFGVESGDRLCQLGNSSGYGWGW